MEKNTSPTLLLESGIKEEVRVGWGGEGEGGQADDGRWEAAETCSSQR